MTDQCYCCRQRAHRGTDCQPIGPCSSPWATLASSRPQAQIEVAGHRLEWAASRLRSKPRPIFFGSVVTVADHGSCRRHPASHLAGVGPAPSDRTGGPCLPWTWCVSVPPRAAHARGGAHGASLPASEATSCCHARHERTRMVRLSAARCTAISLRDRGAMCLSGPDTGRTELLSGGSRVRIAVGALQAA